MQCELMTINIQFNFIAGACLTAIESVGKTGAIKLPKPYLKKTV